MKKKAFHLKRFQSKPDKYGMRRSGSSILDKGSMYDSDEMNQYFDALFKREAENIRSLGLDPESFSLNIHLIEQ